MQQIHLVAGCNLLRWECEPIRGVRAGALRNAANAQAFGGIPPGVGTRHLRRKDVAKSSLERVAFYAWDGLTSSAVSIHDERPSGGGAHRDDRVRDTEGSGPGTYNYYDDAAYSDGTATSVVDRRYEDDYYEPLPPQRKQFGWNVGADFGLLVIRLVLGGIFAAHGAQKLFGVLGGSGPEAFAQSLAKSGFQQSQILSLVTGGTELGAGALLVLGLFTPLAAAGIAGVMASAVIGTRLGDGFFSPDGYEYNVVLTALAVGLMFIGPGRAALDNGRSWFRHPVVSGIICLLIAAGSSAGVLFFLH